MLMLKNGIIRIIQICFIKSKLSIFLKLYIEKWLKNGGNVSGVAIFVKVNFVFNLINAYGQFYIYRTQKIGVLWKVADFCGARVGKYFVRWYIIILWSGVRIPPLLPSFGRISGFFYFVLFARIYAILRLYADCFTYSRHNFGHRKYVYMRNPFVCFTL